MKRTLLALGIALALVGCASPDYANYTAAQTARTNAESKRLDNIASIARESNDPVARVAAIITLSNAEARNQQKIEKPTNILTEVVQAGAGIYGTWAQTLLGVLDLRRSTSAISEQDAAAAISILKPNTK
jgi:PBP1b-binding outer membrane lipoprotein LpoB